MNCPKCGKENICPCGCGLVKKSNEVEMEDKGVIVSGMTETNEVIKAGGVIKWSNLHLYQCPVCKNIEIQ